MKVASTFLRCELLLCVPSFPYPWVRTCINQVLRSPYTVIQAEHAILHVKMCVRVCCHLSKSFLQTVPTREQHCAVILSRQHLSFQRGAFPSAQHLVATGASKERSKPESEDMCCQSFAKVGIDRECQAAHHRDWWAAVPRGACKRLRSSHFCRSTQGRFRP
jgi:hypothetical protein